VGGVARMDVGWWRMERAKYWASCRGEMGSRWRGPAVVAMARA